MHLHHPYVDPEGFEDRYAEIFPDEGLDMIFAVVPKNGTAPANTWLALFTAYSASTVGSNVAHAASLSEPSGGAYARQTIAAASWGTVGATQSGRGTGAAQVTFATATAVWGTVNGFAIMSSLQTGAIWNMCNFDDVTAVAINTNDVIKVTPTWVYTG